MCYNGQMMIRSFLVLRSVLRDGLADRDVGGLSDGDKLGLALGDTLGEVLGDGDGE